MEPCSPTTGFQTAHTLAERQRKEPVAGTGRGAHGAMPGDKAGDGTHFSQEQVRGPAQGPEQDKKLLYSYFLSSVVRVFA